MNTPRDPIPGNIDTWLAQAVAQLRQGGLAAAETLFQRILEVSPDHTDANHLLGIIAIQRAQYDLASQLITRAIKHNPRVAMFHNNLGYAKYQQGRFDEALLAYEQAIRLDPNLSEAYHNFGNTLRELGRVNEALAAYDRAIQLNPNHADAHYNRGNLLLAAGRGREAEGSYRRALELNPHNAAAYNNLGVALVDARRYQEALTACERAIQLRPDYGHAYNCRGNALLAVGRAEEAEDAYKRALELHPDNAQLHSSLLFLQAARARLPFGQMRDALFQWDRIHGQEGHKRALPSRTVTGSSERRLRIGYVSPHLRSHVVNFFFEPLLAAHDRAQYEIFCYASYLESRSDEVTKRLRAIAEHWRFVRDLDDAALARLIHEDGIDILVDLAGHTTGNRLKAFAYRPAPVQATYLGFFATTGLAAMDYWITDEVLHPLDTPELATEKIYRLPRCWVCYQPSTMMPEIAPCPNDDARVVFGSFNDLSKLTPDVIETWSQILQRLPGSRLLVMARTLGDPMTRSLLTGQFASHDITQERLLLRNGAPYSQYFATYAEVDIALDPFPRTGGTTTAEALWMGVPVVTLAGQRYVERISASKLTAVGLEGLITKNREEYIQKAISLAHDPLQRADLRKNMRERMALSPLCDGQDLAHAMESAYKDMWTRNLSQSS